MLEPRKFVRTMFIQLIAVVGTILGFICSTLSVAAGLYYMSEIIEDNIEFTRRTLSICIKGLSAILILLWLFDDFSLKHVLFTLFSYYVYSLNLKHFPIVNIKGPIFIATCILAILNHYFWFRYFSNPYIPPLEDRLDPNFKMPHYPTFAEIASFFGICVWFVPFALFISLSSADSSLPLTASDLSSSNQTDKKVNKSVNLIRYLLSQIAQTIDKGFKLLGINFNFRSRNDSSNPNEIYA